MKRNLKKSLIGNKHLLASVFTFVLAVSFNLPFNALAAPVALATSPLVSATTSAVKPNVMFILDDSRSMEGAFLPDWVDDNHPTTNIKYTSMPELNQNGGFNGMAYNPAITYLAPVYYNADGSLNTTTYPSQTGTSLATGADTSIAMPNWQKVKDDGYGIQQPATTTSNLVETGFHASYFVFVPGEYCTNDNLTNCVTAGGPTATYSKPAVLRWCNSTALTTCRNINNSTYKYPRYAGFVKRATSTITVTGVSGSPSVTSVKVNGEEILSNTTGSQTSNNSLASAISAKINNCTIRKSGTLCTVTGYSATVSNNVVKITAPASLSAITYTPNVVKSGTVTPTSTAFSGGSATVLPGSNILTDIVSGTNSYPYPGSTVKALTRTDCAGTTCTYVEEMTNYANWWAYYHTRMQAMKTSVSRSFQTLDNRYRVGFTTISDTGVSNGTGFSNKTFLGNDVFETEHKNRWYIKLLQSDPSPSGITNYTPLRGALSKAGRYYGNRYTGQIDPVQYSCQQNFTILSTDGYWNSYAKTSSSSGEVAGSYTALNLTGGAIGNLDAVGTTDRPKREGTPAVSNTLADIAKYYYDTDLRTGSFDPPTGTEATLNNCGGGASTDFPSGNPDVCFDNVFVSKSDTRKTQHMTTFTMGLGADGTITYSSDYLNIQKDTPTNTYPAPTSGFDYYNLLNGYASTNWSDPISKTEGERIDDLWHAAVNGQGIYFSAKDPNQIIEGFNRALKSIDAKLGSAAGAATSTLNPVASNNFAYVASYTSVKWTGNLEARTINTVTGETSETATWCVETIAKADCATPLISELVGSSTVSYCHKPVADASQCASPNIYIATTTPSPTCKIEMQNACTGTMAAKIGPTAASTPCYNNPNCDTRTIYTAPLGATPLSVSGVNQKLVNFDSTFGTNNLTLLTTGINGLNQWGSLSTTQQNAAKTNLVNYLRGQKGREIRGTNLVVDQLYRARETVLGDALESQPTFASKPVFSYPDTSYPGYAKYKEDQKLRAGTVFLGANDGMMHAFATSEGTERWAYVPSMVLPNLWKLASNSYDINHTNFVNGSPTISDVCVASCTNATLADWRTILVGGLNGGGRGYYALDITNPDLPVLLWELTPVINGTGTVKDEDVGYSFGKPIITRKEDGTWVVVVTSGYNNTTGTGIGVGKGYLYVLKATDGTIISKLTTGEGDNTTPSGLAKVVGWNNDPAGNSVGFIYGGDLLGNLWRFDINSSNAAVGTSAVGNGDVMKMAILKDASGVGQPITTTPVLGTIAGKRVVFVGTGKYLEVADLTTTQQQTQYAITDEKPTNTVGNSYALDNPAGSPRSSAVLVKQTISTSTATADRTVTPNSTPPNFYTGRGWYVDFPAVASGKPAERVNIDSQLVLGTLIVPTIVPENSICSPGGSSWLNFFDFATGAAVLPGIVVSRSYNSPIVGFNIVYIDGKPKVSVVTSANPTPELDPNVPFSDPNAPFKGKRTLWRELIQ